MGIFKRLFGGVGGKKKVRIVVVGLDNSGKTTVLNALKPKKASLETVPTVGFSTEEFQKHGINFCAFDMSGQSRYRNLWEHYYGDVEGIIVVVDASDKLRFAVVKDEMESMLQDERVNSVQGIEANAVSFADYVAGLDAPGPALPAEKAALIVLPEPSWKVSMMAVSDVDEVIELQCAAMDYTETAIDIEPMMNTYQDYFFGLTADSHASFTIDYDRSSPIEGTMGRRGGEPLTIIVKCDTNGQVGEFVAHVGCILPDEPDFNKFYKITVTTK